MNTHIYKVHTEWTGNTGEGTLTYQSYLRDFNLFLENKPTIQASADIPFRGDGNKINPEDMLLSALSSCHMLWFLHECADHNVIVVSYNDFAEGIMEVLPGKGGRFTEVTLHPVVIVSKESDIMLCTALHETASMKCFIANSCNFPINVIGKHTI